MPEREWVMRRADEEAEKRLAASLGISPFLARLLCHRGQKTPDQAWVFLYGDLQHLRPSSLLPGMDRAVTILEQAITAREKVFICGDYDVDGLAGTALLLSFFAALGLQTGYYIPHRLSEGYGLHREALVRALAAGYRLAVTVDCGLAAAAEVAWAEEQGMKVIVTDHHRPPPLLPAASAVVLPPPQEPLAGVGVAFHLARALNTSLGNPVTLEAFLDLVALGTIADAVPLVGDNRLLVRQGLRLLARGTRPGLRALAAVSGLGDRSFDPRSVAFSLVPRLNAAGRLGDAQPALALLLSETVAEAEELAEVLDRLNRERQAIEGRMLSEVREAIAAQVNLETEPVIVLASPHWHHGVAGIVAGRLAEEYRRPVVLLAVEGEEARGSARSVPGFALYEMLADCRDLLTRFGGHDQAAGLSLPVAHIPLLRQRLCLLAREQAVPGQEPPLLLEASLSLHEVEEKLCEEIGLLAPFGEGNPAPLLITRGARVVEARAVGREGEHLRLTVEEGGVRKSAVGFGMGALAPEVAGRYLDLAFTPILDVFNGQRQVELHLADLRRCVAATPVSDGGDRFLLTAPIPPGSCLRLTGADFFPFLRTLARRVREGTRPWLLVVPSASLASCFALWLREMGLKALRLGAAARRHQVHRLIARLDGAKGAVLVTTPGLVGQHAAALGRLSPFLAALGPELTLEGGLDPVLRFGFAAQPSMPSVPAWRLDAGGLKALVASERRLVIYLRRPQQVALVLTHLRKVFPERAGLIAAYHQELPPQAKAAAIKNWQSGRCQVLVATPAAAPLASMGTGEEIVFAYPPFALLEYCLLSSQAAAVYCTWPQREEEVNERHLSALWPVVPGLRQTAEKTLPAAPVVLAAMEELGLPEAAFGESAAALTASWRWREAKEAQEAWEAFRSFAGSLPWRRGGI